VPYVRPDTPLANAPAMLFKDSVTVSSAPTTPITLSHPSSEKGGSSQLKHATLDNITASAYMTDRSIAPGGSGVAASILHLGKCAHGS
jgi:hypothetical protein